MIGQQVRYELKDGVAFLTLNNPGRRNALSTELLGDSFSRSCLREFEHDDSVRVVVLRSEGPGVQFRPRPERDDRPGLRGLHCRVRPVHGGHGGHSPAAQAGHRAGAGPCHRRRLPAGRHVRSGRCCRVLPPSPLPACRSACSAPGPGVALARSVATTKKAMEMLLTGTPVPASEALEIGLINRVVARR